MDPYNTLDTRKRSADTIEFTDPWSAERKVNDRSNTPCYPQPQQPTKLHTKKRS